MEFFKIAVSKAPIPAIGGFLVYFIFDKIVEKSTDNNVYIVISILTFISLFLFLFIPEYKKLKSSKITIKENELSDIEIDSGDAFIGEKSKCNNEFLIIQKNSVKNIKSKNGDVFIGKKVDSKDE